jgi:hypothetical protein
MGTLSINWITEKLIDFEYKKYVLLSYLQDVKANFSQKKLYPDLSELITHYKNLMSLKNNAQTIEHSLSKRIKNIDFKNMSFEYEKMEDDDVLEEIKKIIIYSEPLIAEELNRGKTLFDFVEKNIEFSHVGILPIYRNEGYFILEKTKSKQAEVFMYKLVKITLDNENAIGLSSDFYNSYSISLSKTIDKVKLELIESNPELPNPAVYLFRAKEELPKNETLLPIAKRILYTKLQEAA